MFQRIEQEWWSSSMNISIIDVLKKWGISTKAVSWSYYSSMRFHLKTAEELLGMCFCSYFLLQVSFQRNMQDEYGGITCSVSYVSDWVYTDFFSGHLCIHFWLVGLEHFSFSHLLGMSSSQLTFIFFMFFCFRVQPKYVVSPDEAQQRWQVQLEPDGPSTLPLQLVRRGKLGKLD